MTFYALNWLETSPAIEIRFASESLPIARYMLSTCTRDGDAPLFHRPYQRDLSALELPASLLPQVDVEGNHVSGIRKEVADAEHKETHIAELVSPRSNTRTNFAYWLYR